VNSYVEIPDLKDVVLEESYVLEIAAGPGSLKLRGEFVLGEQHAAYYEPPADESDCFVPGVLRFDGVQSLVWEGQGAPAAADATDEIDYGHIDDLVWDGEVFELEGDWGRIRVVASSIGLELET
jgi:hypothetical protein